MLIMIRACMVVAFMPLPFCECDRTVNYFQVPKVLYTFLRW
jgi:hypothetical protein